MVKRYLWDQYDGNDGRLHSDSGRGRSIRRAVISDTMATTNSIRSDDPTEIICNAIINTFVTFLPETITISFLILILQMCDINEENANQNTNQNVSLTPTPQIQCTMQLSHGN